MNLFGMTSPFFTSIIVKSLLSFLLIFSLFIFGFIVLPYINRKFMIRYTRNHKIEIKNDSNFSSKFHLSATSSENNVLFEFLLNNIPLPNARSLSPIEPLQNGDQETEQNPGSARPLAGSISRTNIIGDVSKGGKAVSSKLGVLASIAGTLGSLLPGGLGSKLSRQSETLRQTQTNVQETVQAPVMARQKVQALNQQSGQILNPNGSNQSFQRALTKSEKSLSDNSNRSQISTSPQLFFSQHEFETPIIDPGESLTLELRIDANSNLDPRKSHRYTITSIQVSEAPTSEFENVIKRDGIVNFKNYPVWRILLTPTLNILAIATLFSLFIFFVNLIW